MERREREWRAVGGERWGESGTSSPTVREGSLVCHERTRRPRSRAEVRGGNMQPDRKGGLSGTNAEAAEQR